MKKLLLPIFIFASTITFAQVVDKNPTDLASDNLKGNVQSVTEKYYQVLQTKAGKDSVGQQWEMTDRNFIMNFNDKGWITWATFYKTESTLDYRYEYKYDAGGNRIQETWFDSDNALDYRITRKFSEKGFLVEMKKYTDTTGTCDEKTIYEVDPTGNPIKTTLYDGTDAVLGSSTYKYDGFGNMIEHDDFDSKGKPTGKIICAYDGRHLKTSEDAYTTGDVIMTKQKFVYEYRGHLSGQQNFDNTGKLVEKNLFTFNDQADVSEWNNYDRTGFEIYNYTYTYEYDSKGNWITKNQLKDGKIVFVSKREIKYGS